MHGLLARDHVSALSGIVVMVVLGLITTGILCGARRGRHWVVALCFLLAAILAAWASYHNFMIANS